MTDALKRKNIVIPPHANYPARAHMKHKAPHKYYHTTTDHRNEQFNTTVAGEIPIHTRRRRPRCAAVGLHVTAAAAAATATASVASGGGGGGSTATAAAAIASGCCCG